MRPEGLAFILLICTFEELKIVTQREKVVEEDATGEAIDDYRGDGCPCTFVDVGNELAEWKDVVASVGESDTGSDIHAAFNHGEAGDDDEAEDGESNFLQDLVRMRRRAGLVRSRRVR